MDKFHDTVNFRTVLRPETLYIALLFSVLMKKVLNFCKQSVTSANVISKCA